MTQITLADALAARDSGMTAVADHAGPSFTERAKDYILAYLTAHGPTSGEDLTEACHRVGIEPHDDRAFGAVYCRLSKQGLIEKCGTVMRKRGNMTTGGNVWRLHREA